MAVLPTRKVEIEFDVGVWTDVAADVVDFQTRRGRNRELGAFETGRLLIRLRNDTRKYDPDYAAGTYYGKLRPNRRVRVRATYNAVTYDAFSGYIDRILQVYGGPNDASAVIEASDFFKILGRVELPSSAYAAEVADDTPTSWWRLDEPAGSTTASSTAGLIGTVTGSPGFAAAGLIVRDPGSAASFVAGQSIELPVGSFPTTTSWTVEFWFVGASVNNLILAHTLSYTTTPSGLQIQTLGGGTGILTIDQMTPGLSDSSANSTISVCDGAVHHCAIVAASGAALKIYIDGIDRTAGGAGTTRSPMSSGPITLNWNGGPASNFTLDDVAFYPAALSAGRIAAHNTAGRTPWNGDLPGTRLQRVAEIVTATGTYEWDEGAPTLQATDLGGTALAYMQKVEETTLGRLFVTRDGTVRFLGRTEAETGAYLTSQATLVDADSGAGLPYRSTSSDVDESTIVTRAAVSREGSVAVTYGDSAAQTEFGLLDETHDGLLHDDDAYSLSYAQMIVNTHKTPASRVGTVELELTGDPAALYPAILGLEIADRVTYKRKPQNTGAVISLPMRVEAIAHETGPHYWRTRLQLSPFYLTSSGALWVLGIAGNSELGQTTTLGL